MCRVACAVLHVLCSAVLYSHARHLEAWYGTMGIGAVTHTLNPRLSDKDIAYIAAHGEDKLVLVDHTLLPILARIAKDLPHLQGVIVLTDRWVNVRASELSMLLHIQYINVLVRLGQHGGLEAEQKHAAYLSLLLQWHGRCSCLLVAWTDVHRPESFVAAHNARKHAAEHGLTYSIA